MRGFGPASVQLCKRFAGRLDNLERNLKRFGYHQIMTFHANPISSTTGLAL